MAEVYGDIDQSNWEGTSYKASILGLERAIAQVKATRPVKIIAIVKSEGRVKALWQIKANWLVRAI